MCDKCWLTGFGVGAAMVMMIFALLFLGPPAHSEEHQHPQKDLQLHEQFYQHWNRPVFRDETGKRTSSCCDNRDCYPTAIRKVDAFTYEAKRRPEDRTADNSEWVKFPATMLEQNQADEEESPDGQSHACISPSADFVYCATLGNGM